MFFVQALKKVGNISRNTILKHLEMSIRGNKRTVHLEKSEHRRAMIFFNEYYNLSFYILFQLAVARLVPQSKTTDQVLEQLSTLY